MWHLFYMTALFKYFNIFIEIVNYFTYLLRGEFIYPDIKSLIKQILVVILGTISTIIY